MEPCAAVIILKGDMRAAVIMCVGASLWLSAEGGEHWAFQPVKRPDLPAVAADDPVSGLVER